MFKIKLLNLKETIRNRTDFENYWNKKLGLILLYNNKTALDRIRLLKIRWS